MRAKLCSCQALNCPLFSAKTARWRRTLENLVSKPASQVGGFENFSSSPKSLTCEAGLESQIFQSPSPVSSLYTKLPPKNLGKITSETTFDHSKVLFWPLLRTKRAFSQNPLTSRFLHYYGMNVVTKEGQKPSTPPSVFFVSLGAPSRPI